MSIKHRVKDRSKNGKIRPLFYGEPWARSREYYPDNGYIDVKKNPAWWNRLTNTRPQRRQARHLCRLICKGIKDYDGVAFPIDHKPNIYFY
ncbi:hypothetical protein EDF88_3556 [Buttiauxella sp. BIGb0552]|uniref:hypothetical protein n=1 Tax=Buttiauxella sp. BIGb0552 TaxID=2485120 RepID=UPI001064B23D|nr:hypothetical protein [Buttiauxella sp. BIGb0552]TDX15117.1 hypothetical protein EDF88_3556 [Buttiauxella sp. BIGb0552]